MLMECLGEGRGISLPAGGVAASRLCTLAVGGYARVRKQFKVPIAEMEGVQEKLSNIGMITYQVCLWLWLRVCTRARTCNCVGPILVRLPAHTAN
jgi:alkylation response protein AidB-like acyl-CoA dehydrogenase